MTCSGTATAVKPHYKYFLITMKPRQRARRLNPAMSDGYSQMLNPLVSASLTREAYIQAMSRFLLHEDPKSFDEKFEKLYSRERFRQELSSESTTIEQMLGQPMFGFRHFEDGTKNNFLLHRRILKFNREKVKIYQKYRFLYEASFLKGDFSQASASLKVLADQLGESLWSVRANIALLSQQGKIDEVEEYVEKCKARSNNTIIRLIFNWFLLVASDPLFHLEKTLVVAIRELAEGGERDWAKLVELLLVPKAMGLLRLDEPCFHVIHTLPMVDQVWLIEVMASDTRSADPHPSHRYLQELAQDIEEIKDEVRNSLGIDKQTLKNSLSRIVSLYEQEDYEELSSVYSSLTPSAEFEFAVINIIAKIQAQSQVRIIFGKSPLAKIVNNLAEIYAINGTPKKLRDDHLSQVANFNGFSGFEVLDTALCLAMPNGIDETLTRKISKSLSSSSIATPMTLWIGSQKAFLLTLRYQSECTFLPAHRRLKQQIIQVVDDPGKSYDTLDKLLDQYQEQCRLKKDALEITSAAYLSTKRLPELISFAARELAIDVNTYAALPMAAMMALVESESFHSLEAVVIAHVYVTYIDRKKDYVLNETFERYLEAENVERPSALFEILDCNDPLVAIFFKDISALDVMDYLGSYETSSELRAERVSILDHLLEKRLIDQEAHDLEVDEILGQIVVDAGAAHFNESKIDINTTELKKLVSGDFKPLMALYKSLDESQADRFIRIEGTEMDDEPAQRAIAVGDRKTTLLRAITLVQNTFLFDEKYGLDKNLSTEIRHGFFSNLMRARLEEKHLLTEADATGKYVSNQFWIAANALLHPDILESVDSNLATFSERFNNLIREAEEWMKIATDGHERGRRVFSYTIDLDEFSKLEVSALNMNADDFLDVVLSLFLKNTYNFLSQVREKLNVEFRTRVSVLLDDLGESIVASKRGAAMLELMGAIEQARHGIQEDITVAAEWFKPSDTSVVSARPIPDLIDISVECFRRIGGVTFHPIIESIQGPIAAKVHGAHVKNFILVLITLFENSFRRSGLGKDTSVLINFSAGLDLFTLRISNSISPDRRSEYDDDFIKNLDTRMRSPKSLVLMRKEGGTGLSKVFNQLRLISQKFDVQLGMNDFGFTVEVRYGDQDTTH